MKKITFLLLIPLLAFSINGWGQIISQYIEANSGTTPKGIEIWNNTAATLDFSTNSLEILKGTNGGTPAVDYTLSTGTLAAGEVIVIGTSDLQTVTENNGSTFYEKAFSFNGDDALEVKYGGTITDVFGTPGSDPGSAWTGNGVSTANQNIQLLFGITTGDTDGWTDPSLRFETVSTDPSGTGGDVGFGLAPSAGSGNSEESDIIIADSWIEATNIDYTLYSAASGLTTSNAIEVGQFTIRDGGATAPDADSEPTILTAITYAIQNSSDIAALAIFDGTTNISEVTSVTSSTGFSGITGLSAPDNGTKDFSIYATFNTVVTDNDNLKFTVSLATADPTGSTFAAADAGGAATDATGDNNKLIVTATKLAISTPVSVVVDTDFTIDVEATDDNGSRDLDEVSSVTLVQATGTGTLTSVTGFTQSLVAGSFQWIDAQYDAVGDFTIEAQSATLTNASSGTITASGTENTNLFISEVTDPSNTANAKYVEIYNAGTSVIDFSSSTWYVSRQANGGATSWADIQLSGSIAVGETYIIANNQTDFTTAFGFEAGQYSGSISGNGDDGYFLYYDGNHTTGTLMDAYGVIDEDGTGKAWEYENTKAVRLRSVTSPNSTWTASEWDIPNSATTTEMTPSEHNEDVIWAGTTDSDWNTKGNNWSGTWGFIPDASFNVTVPNVSNLPTISGQSACFDLTVQSASSLTVSVNNGLTVYGDLDATSGTLTVQSDASGNGSLIVKGTPSGDVTVERYMVGYDVADNGWHNIGSPVDNMLISDSDFDPTGTSDDLYQWNESTEIWENYKQNHFTNFVNGKGYLCAIETTDTRNFVGTLNTADYTQSGLTKDVLGFNMLGNPYASALVWNNGDWTLNNVGAVAQIWEETNGSYTPIAADGIIPSTNGFFVEVATVAGGSVTIPASARTHNATNNYKNVVANNYEETLDLKVTNDENMFYDITRVAFKDDATEAWDIQYDAHKLFGGSTTSQLWSVMGDENFVFNYLPYIYESYQLPINFRAGVNATHHINAEGVESFFGSSGIYLEDLKTGELINLSEQQMYTFTASTEDDEARFILHFSGITSIGEEMYADDVQIYSNGNSVYFRFKTMPENDVQVSVFNTIGQQVYTGEVGQSTLSSIRLNEKPGIYIVQLQTDKDTTTQKVMIK